MADGQKIGKELVHGTDDESKSDFFRGRFRRTPESHAAENCRCLNDPHEELEAARAPSQLRVSISARQRSESISEESLTLQG